jgi:multisubunit Na+/H+ antiporter MnhG subunit
MANRPPAHLLQQTHSIATITATVGFVFAIVGVLCYAWSQQARSVSIFSSACVGACFLISLVVVGPFTKAEKRI